jgi:alpha-L-fucosidase
MMKLYSPALLLAASLWFTQSCPAQNPIVPTVHTAGPAVLAPMPAVAAPQAQDSVPMGDVKSFPEMKWDIPVAPGPFEPTWESIEKNCPGEPAWLREAKFGIWVHFGPQSAGESGDWYARRLYAPGFTYDSGMMIRYVIEAVARDGELQWKQEADGLAITCPTEMPFETSIAFKIE